MTGSREGWKKEPDAETLQIWRELFPGLLQTESTGRRAPSGSDEEAGSSRAGAAHTPLTRSATRGAAVEHTSLLYGSIRGPKKTVQQKIWSRSLGGDEGPGKMATPEQMEQVREQVRQEMVAQREADQAALAAAQAREEELARQVELLQAGGRLPPADQQAQQQHLQQPQLQQQAGNWAMVPQAPQRPVVRMNDAIPTLPRFDGVDRARPAQPWLDSLELYGAAYGWGPVDTMIAAKQCLDGPARTWVLGQHHLLTWERFRAELEDEFGGEVSAADIMLEMQKRKRRPGEAASEYIQVMWNLGAQCAMAERDVIRFIAEGITSDELTIRELRSVNGYRQLKEKVQLFEEYKVSGLGFSSASRKTGERAGSKPAGQVTSRSSKDGKCFTCGKDGHIKRNCPDKDKGKTCYICSKTGHMAHACPDRKAPVPARGAQVNRMEGQPADGGSNPSNRNWKSVTLEGKRVIGLIDSGSNYNLMREDIYRDLKPLPMGEEPERLRGVGGTICTLGKVKAATEIDGSMFLLTYRVVPEGTIPEGILLGEDLQNQAVIQLGPGQPVVFPTEAYLLQVKAEEEVQLPSLGHLDQQQEREVKRMIMDYQPTEKKEVPVEMKILLKDDTPISRPPYRLAPKEKKEVDE